MGAPVIGVQDQGYPPPGTLAVGFGWRNQFSDKHFVGSHYEEQRTRGQSGHQQRQPRGHQRRLPGEQARLADLGLRFFMATRSQALRNSNTGTLRAVPDAGQRCRRHRVRGAPLDARPRHEYRRQHPDRPGLQAADRRGQRHRHVPRVLGDAAHGSRTPSVPSISRSSRVTAGSASSWTSPPSWVSWKASW